MRPLLLFLVVGAALPASAQRPKKYPPADTSTVIVFSLGHKTKLVGRVVAADDRSLSVITLERASVVLAHDSIVEWRKRPGTWTDAGFRPADLGTSRLFFGPTARTLERGHGYFSDYYLFIGSGGYAVHDRVLLSAATNLGEDPEHHTGAGYIAAKIGIVQRRNVAFAVGAFRASQRALTYHWSVSDAYGVLTLGGNDHALTVLGGLPLASDSVARRAIFMAGGQARVSGRLKLMTEVWRLPTKEVPAILGVRWFGEQFTIEVGEIHTFGALHPSGPPWVPWVGASIP
ncbi:MAG TPA: hypothetical protein VFP39_13520 [Gemmatimonadales bacterium]|nr:hypothetical protein [Gemmatimonadales bacterium]